MASKNVETTNVKITFVPRLDRGPCILSETTLSLQIVPCQGMCYLHGSSLRSHGSLKSSNCLIDSRWVLKISNYGMDAFREEREVGEHEMYRDLQWTAPELLRLADSVRPRYGTQKGDVYSFAIIMHEIVHRGMPFGGDLSPQGKWKHATSCLKNGCGRSIKTKSTLRAFNVNKN